MNATSRAHSIVGTSPGRADADFYPTPPAATLALLRAESFDPGLVWEPACGDGAMAEVLKAQGMDVMATDLVQRGYGEAPIDFLRCRRRARHIITNPPFRLGRDFVAHALAHCDGKVAMLLKLAFLEGGARKAFFAETPLARVHVFSERVSMTRNGVKMDNGGMIAFAWFIWDHDHAGPPVLGWL